MARWSEQAAELIAPGLDWTATVAEHADFELAEAWEASHVVRYQAGSHGEGVSQLTAGGRGKKIGGAGRITLRSIRPFAFFEADGHCDVEHWDIVAGGITEQALDAVRLLLEAEIGARANVALGAMEQFELGLVDVATTDDEEEARLWAGDLDDVGLIARADAHESGWMVRVEVSEVGSLVELQEARVTLGEVLAEAGHQEWAEMADALLARMPHRDPT